MFLNKKFRLVRGSFRHEKRRRHTDIYLFRVLFPPSDTIFDVIMGVEFPVRYPAGIYLQTHRELHPGPCSHMCRHGKWGSLSACAKLVIAVIVWQHLLRDLGGICFSVFTSSGDVCFSVTLHVLELKTYCCVWRVIHDSLFMYRYN